MLPQDRVAVVEELQRRHEELGASYLVTGVGFAGRLAPVVNVLSGR